MRTLIECKENLKIRTKPDWLDNLVINSEDYNKFNLKDICNKLIRGECLQTMSKIPSDIVDLVFIDPPYFLQVPPKKLLRWSGSQVNGVNESWDIFKDFTDYDNFTMQYLKETQRIMKQKATIWIIGTYHNIHRIGKIMQDLGFWILNDVIWFKTNPMPNFLGVRFTNATETLIWAVKDKNVKGHTFNKDIAKKMANGKLGINVWQIPLCTGFERLRDEKGQKIHPTQKPEALMEKIILTSTKQGDLVLDPMAGTGTTGFISKKLNRDFVMIEKDEKYIKTIKKRFNYFLQYELVRNHH